MARSETVPQGTECWEVVSDIAPSPRRGCEVGLCRCEHCSRESSSEAKRGRRDWRSRRPLTLRDGQVCVQEQQLEEPPSSGPEQVLRAGLEGGEEESRGTPASLTRLHVPSMGRLSYVLGVPKAKR